MSRNEKIAVTVGVTVVVILFAIFGVISMNSSSNNSNSNPATTLGLTETSVGTGAVAVVGSHVYVQYTGKLVDGTVFDSSIPRGQPIDFTLGQGQVIPGWEQGILGMKVGGKRHLVIPPGLAYGAQAVGPIPANSTLIFDVELVDVK